MNRMDKLIAFVYNIELLDTPTEKKAYIDATLKLNPEMTDDFELVIEVLSGMKKLGYTYDCWCGKDATWVLDDNCSFRDVYNYLMLPREQHDLSRENILLHCLGTTRYCTFLYNVFNRNLKLGIGKSLLSKSMCSPMLAKKYGETLLNDSKGYYITEKLDGNRCIAQYDFSKDEWLFYSRNGKLMKVSFDMSGLSKDYIYDGEVLSATQTENSDMIYNLITKGIAVNHVFDDLFSSTSGLINSNATNKNLVFNIFDIVTSEPYVDRRKQLNEMHPESKQVRIVPVLAYMDSTNSLNEHLGKLLEDVTRYNAEGLMINNACGMYTHNRTDVLLKVKKAYTMDMRVKGVYGGNGKYDGMLGGLYCECVTSDGKMITCEVGTGISDAERVRWYDKPYDIVGKIVEVEYFSLSQNKLLVGTNAYSLRFPRLKRVRTDKDEVSEN